MTGTARRPGEIVLDADSLGRSFRRRTVLKAASFQARAGRVTALLGRNGSGKTTLFRLAVGLLRRDHGRVAYLGRVRPRPRLHRLAREGLFYVPQGTGLTPHFTVDEHLGALARAFEVEDMDRVVEAMRLEEARSRRPPRLSGGEKQRAVLAMVLARRPRCLLHDEPFAGIAPSDRDLVAAGLRRLREGGTAIVLTGHDVDDLLAVADEVVWVVAGTSHVLGSPQEARQHHQFATEYLGPRRS